MVAKKAVRGTMLKIWRNDKCFSSSRMRLKALKMMSEHTMKKPLILIDYLTLIHSKESNSNMHLQVSSVTKALKSISLAQSSHWRN